MKATLNHTEEAAQNQNQQQGMPLHRFLTYQVAKELFATVVAAKISEPTLRDQAMRAAQSSCLNIAEAAGRWSTRDRAHKCHIARGECCEVVAALEIAAIAGACDAEIATKATAIGTRLYALLSGLIRK